MNPQRQKAERSLPGLGEGAGRPRLTGAESRSAPAWRDGKSSGDEGWAVVQQRELLTASELCT